MGSCGSMHDLAHEQLSTINFGELYSLLTSNRLLWKILTITGTDDLPTLSTNWTEPKDRKHRIKTQLS